MSDSSSTRMSHYGFRICPLRDKHCSCVESRQFGSGKVCAFKNKDGRNVLVADDNNIRSYEKKVEICPISDEEFKEYKFNEVSSVV